MATTVAQHPVTAFTSPTNGTSPIDADEVVANDSAIRAAYNAHDADTGIHVQSSVFGSRPAAGTSGRKFITVDQLSAPTQIRSFYDDGTNWYEHNYFGSATTIAAALTVSSGGIAVTGNSTITGTLGGITTLTATTVAGTLSTAAQPNVTSVGTLSSLTVSGDVTVDTSTLKVDSANNRVGVRTTSPATTLHVVGNGASSAIVQLTTSGTGHREFQNAISGGGSNYDSLYWLGNTASGGGTFAHLMSLSADGTLGIGYEVQTGLSGKLLVDGNVGIGTSSPSTPLHVVGASTLAGAVTVSAGSTTNALTVTTTGAIQGSFRYDSSNRLDISVSSAGAVTFDAVGASAGVTFSDGVTVSGALTASSSLQVSGTFSALGNITLGNANTDTIEVQGVFINNLVPFVSSGYSLGTSGNTWSAAYADRVFTAASATGGAGLRLPHGAAPTSPVDGDMWTTSSGLFVRINGVTKTVTLT